MMTGFDSRTFEPDRLKEFEESYQVKMKAEDVDCGALGKILSVQLGYPGQV